MTGKDYLTLKGRIIFSAIAKHLKDKGVEDSITSFELSMLANSFDMYAEAAMFCNKNGNTLNSGDKGYMQVHPKYTIMKNEYTHIQKHAPKFGLNPLDVQKLTRALPEKQEEDPLAALAV